jgi:hypothetical protein
MSERGLRVGIAAVATAGIGLAAYLLYARETGATLVCASGGCETAQSSRYVQLHLIGAVCELCLLSDVLIATAAALTLLRLQAAVGGGDRSAGRGRDESAGLVPRDHEPHVNSGSTHGATKLREAR